MFVAADEADVLQRREMLRGRGRRAEHMRGRPFRDVVIGWRCWAALA
jgi:hypothetical protein